MRNIIKNKKAFAIPLLMMMGVIIFAALFIFSISANREIVNNIGQTEIGIIHAIEDSERKFSYIDMSIDLATKITMKNLMQNIGHNYETYQGKIKQPPCGSLQYPIINNETSIQECIPNLEQSFKKLLRTNMNTLLTKGPIQNIQSSDFQINKNSNNFFIKFLLTKELETPIYTYIEGYYAKSATEQKNKETYATNENNYLQRQDLTTYNRQDKTPQKIIILDTMNQNTDQTINQLKNTNKNYHYIIDKDGKIYQQAEEDQATKILDCNEETNNCYPTEEELKTITIAMMSCAYSSEMCEVNDCYKKTNEICYDKYTTEQLKTLPKLIAEISLRNEQITIDKEHIQTYSEIQENKNNPTLHLKDQYETIITQAKKEQEILLKPKQTNTENTENEITGNIIITGMVPAEIENIPPTFNGNIETTVYFSASSADYEKWYSGAGDKYDTTTKIGWCIIPQKERGFYEDVKCQGSGVHEGKVQYYEYIKKNPAESPPLEGFHFGKTSQQTDPMPKRTVAVNPLQGSNCYIPYGTKMYIYFEEGNPWNGYYVAEDTGKAFKGECKIDIFAGVGEEAVKEAEKWVSKKHPKIYILDENYEIPESNNYFALINSITGTYKTKYSYETDLTNYENLIIESKNIAKEILTECPPNTKQTNTEKQNCIENAIQQIQTQHNLIISNNCEQTTSGQNQNLLTPINKIDQKEGFINIKGKITKKSEITKDEEIEVLILTALESIGNQILTKVTEWATIDIEDETGTQQITLVNEALEIYEALNINQEITITNILKNQTIIKNPKDIIMSDTQSQKQNIYEFTKQIAECTTAKQNKCRCTTTYQGNSGELKITKDTTTHNTQGNEEKLSETTQIYSTLNLKDPQIKIINITNNQKYVFFKNEKGQIEQYKTQNTTTLPECTPQKTYQTICVTEKINALNKQQGNIQQNNNQQIYKTTPNTVNFVLVI